MAFAKQVVTLLFANDPPGQNWAKSWPDAVLPAVELNPPPSRPADMLVDAFAYGACAAPVVWFMLNGRSQMPRPTSPQRPPSQTPLFRQPAKRPLPPPLTAVTPPIAIDASAWKPM